MKKYRNNLTGKIATIINDKAAGMGNWTLGRTFIIYEYEDDKYDFPFIMEHTEFYKEHTEIV